MDFSIVTRLAQAWCVLARKYDIMPVITLFHKADRVVVLVDDSPNDDPYHSESFYFSRTYSKF